MRNLFNWLYQLNLFYLLNLLNLLNLLYLFNLFYLFNRLYYDLCLLLRIELDNLYWWLFINLLNFSYWHHEFTSSTLLILIYLILLLLRDKCLKSNSWFFLLCFCLFYLRIYLNRLLWILLTLLYNFSRCFVLPKIVLLLIHIHFRLYY